MRLLIKVYWLEVKGFNPRTRKGCDKFTSPDRMQLIVSIHAPVKDATRRTINGCQSHTGFNPRTRKGCDVCRWLVDGIIGVSIHAPVKDATCRISLGIIQGMRFNPRTRKGCDDRSAGYPKIVDKFQSTHP